MHFSTHVEDDRTAFEQLRLSQLRAIARENNIDVPVEMTSAGLIPILEGRGVRPRAPSIRHRGLGAEKVAEMRDAIEADIEQMKPSELMAKAKQFGVEMNIRMNKEEMAAAKKELIGKM